MKKILIVTRKNRTDTETETAQSVKATLEHGLPGARVQIDDELDWKRITSHAKSVAGGYRWAAMNFDIFILIEDSSGLLARGQYSIAEQALNRGKAVKARRAGTTTNRRIASLEVVDKNSWKQGYGKAV